MLIKCVILNLKFNRMESIFKTLHSIDVREKIERKGNIEYLSWANAWSMLCLQYPTAKRTIYESEQTGFIYHTDGRTAWVKVGVTVNDIEHIDYLPIMDFRNNAIPVEKITSVDVNKTIQRSTAKAIAMHGLGIQLWSGEDAMEPETPKQKTEEKKSKKITLKINDENWVKVAKYVATNKAAGAETIIKQLEQKYILPDDTKEAIVNLI